MATNITVLVKHCSYDGKVPGKREIVNLDIPYLRQLLSEKSMLIFEHGHNDFEEIIIDAYDKKP